MATNEPTVEQLKAAMNKAKAAGNEELASRLARAALELNTKQVASQKEAEAVAKERKEFVQYTPTMRPFDDIKNDLYTGVQGALDGGVDTIRAIEEERQSVPQDKRMPLIPATILGSQDLLKPTDSTAPRSLEEAALHMAAEGVLPAAGSMFVEYGTAVGKVLGNLTPDVIEKPTVEAVKGLVFDVGQSEWYNDFTKAAGEGWESAKEWMDLNPRETRQLSSLSSIALFKGKKPPSSVVALKGKELSIWGAQGARTQRDKGIFNLMMPDQKDMYKSDRGTRTTSKDGTITWTPSKVETDRLLELKKVPSFDPNAPVGFNVDKVYENIDKLNDRVIENIYANGNPKISKYFVINKLESDVEGMVMSNGWKAINGAPSQVAPLMEHLKDLVQRSDGTTAGLLQVRKDFDTFIMDWKPADIEGGLVNSRAQIVKLTRGVLNKEVAAMIPDSPSQSLLTRQSRLYQNLDVLEPKAASEILGVFGKTQNWVREHVGITVPKTPASIAGAVAISTGILSASWMPAVATGAAVAGATALSVNALRSPTMRKFAGASLTALSKVMAVTTDPIKLNLMKADRAVLIHYMSKPPVAGEEVEETQQ